MKKISILLVISLFWITSIGQPINLRTEVEGTPRHVKTKISKRPVLLYFMSGFDDSVCVYYNKELVLCSYIPSVSTLGHDYGISPINLTYNDYGRSNVLEFAFVKSRKLYTVKLIKGYLCALLYLGQGKNTVLFTHKSPMLE